MVRILSYLITLIDDLHRVLCMVNYCDCDNRVECANNSCITWFLIRFLTIRSFMYWPGILRYQVSVFEFELSLRPVEFRGFFWFCNSTWLRFSNESLIQKHAKSCYISQKYSGIPWCLDFNLDEPERIYNICRLTVYKHR